MEESDRLKIITNIVQLCKIRNQDLFYSELIARHVFSPELLENILCQKRNIREQLQKVFLEICYRGPQAFEKLIEALRRSGNNLQAKLLDPNANHDNDYFDEDENLVGVELHRNLVNESSSFRNIHSDDMYEIASRPRGFALIINVIDFDGNPGLKRIGAEEDSLTLKKLLEKFDYQVDVVINPKKKVMLDKSDGILKTFTNKFYEKTVDSCIVAIMSHGEDNFWVQTSDCESMNDDHAHLVNLWEDVFPRFNNQHFSIMRNKPKIFIVQSCRGDRSHRNIRLSSGSSLLKTDFGRRNSIINPETYYENHPEFNHMMILQSTIPGYVSLRHEELGTPFIRILCQSIEENGRRMWWGDMVSEIAKRLQAIPEEDGGPQTCTHKTVGYCKKFRFTD